MGSAGESVYQRAVLYVDCIHLWLLVLSYLFQDTQPSHCLWPETAARGACSPDSGQMNNQPRALVSHIPSYQKSLMKQTSKKECPLIIQQSTPFHVLPRSLPGHNDYLPLVYILIICTISPSKATRKSTMRISVEAIVAIVSLIVAAPCTAVLVWKVLPRRKGDPQISRTSKKHDTF